jgi:FKBP-type peptidyl-prolyl cis-trans isomerase
MTRKNIIITLTAFTLTAVMAITACKNDSKKSEFTGTLNNELDSFSYAIGLINGLQVKEQGITAINAESMIEGFNHGLQKDSGFLMDEEELQMFLMSYISTAREGQSESNKEESKKYIDEMSKKENVQKTESGLLYEQLLPGDGVKPNLTDTVVVSFIVKLPNGKVIMDTEEDFGGPIPTPLTRLLPGLTEGIQLMNEGAIFNFYIPYHLGFGKEARGVPPNSAVYCQVTLMEVKS